VVYYQQNLINSQYCNIMKRAGNSEAIVVRLFEQCHDLYSIVCTSSLQFLVSCTSFKSISTNVANTKTMVGVQMLMSRCYNKTFISNKYSAIIYQRSPL